ncbi:hypothetical protein [Ruegeria arenilitoris]|uniref:hypothetical protein n=1 Tax=Ruegeria arenilitoris TaxID=1173585 RepID=UPI00147C8A8C|nr:hypothetical protein [Ruegeria arenilitoris]
MAIQNTIRRAISDPDQIGDVMRKLEKYSVDQLAENVEARTLNAYWHGPLTDVAGGLDIEHHRGAITLQLYEIVWHAIDRHRQFIQSAITLSESREQAERVRRAEMV